LQITLENDLKKLFFISLDKILRNDVFKGCHEFFRKFILNDRDIVITSKRKFIQQHKRLVLRNVIQEYGRSYYLVKRCYFQKWIKLAKLNNKIFSDKRLLRLHKAFEMVEKLARVNKYINIKYCCFSKIGSTVVPTAISYDRRLVRFQKMIDLLWDISKKRKQEVFNQLYTIYGGNSLAPYYETIHDMINTSIDGGIDYHRQLALIKLNNLTSLRSELKFYFLYWYNKSISPSINEVTTFQVNPVIMIVNLLKYKFNMILRETLSHLVLYSSSNDKANNLIFYKNLYFFENNYNHILLNMIKGFDKIFRLKKERRKFIINLYNDNRNFTGLRNYFLLWCYVNKKISKEKDKLFSGVYNLAIKVVFVIKRGINTRLKLATFEQIKNFTINRKDEYGSFEKLQLFSTFVGRIFSNNFIKHKRYFVEALEANVYKERQYFSDLKQYSDTSSLKSKLLIFTKNLSTILLCYKSLYFNEFIQIYSQRMAFHKIVKANNFIDKICQIFSRNSSVAFKQLKRKFYIPRKGQKIDYFILTNTAMINQDICNTITKKAKNLKIFKALKAIHIYKTRNARLQTNKFKYLEKYFLLWKDGIIQEKLTLIGDIKAYNEINVIANLSLGRDKSKD
jgi:hypothetical protein